jgi:hypothetical protein
MKQERATGEGGGVRSVGARAGSENDNRPTVVLLWLRPLEDVVVVRVMEVTTAAGSCRSGGLESESDSLEHESTRRVPGKERKARRICR